ncbi:hypothetical protein [Emticicia sp. 17c]
MYRKEPEYYNEEISGKGTIEILNLPVVSQPTSQEIACQKILINNY